MVICDDDLMFPNGVALTPDEKFLVIAETFGERVAVLELGDSGRRWSVAAPGTYPDGVCAAGDDSFWFADARGKRCLQGSLADEIIQTRQFSRLCYAPAVNADGSRLYTTAADGFDPTASARGNAAVVWARSRRRVPWPTQYQIARPCQATPPNSESLRTVASLTSGPP
jgi:sugar lactone lactonase YvrE